MTANESHNPYRPTTTHCARRYESAWSIIVVMFAVVMMLCIPVAYIVGEIVGVARVRDAFATEQQREIEALLDTKYSGRLTEIRVEKGSEGWSFLTGKVHSASDLELLKEDLRVMFGDSLAERMTTGIVVEESPKDPKGKPE